LWLGTCPTAAQADWRQTDGQPAETAPPNTFRNQRQVRNRRSALGVATWAKVEHGALKKPPFDQRFLKPGHLGSTQSPQTLQGAVHASLAQKSDVQPAVQSSAGQGTSKGYRAARNGFGSD